MKLLLVEDQPELASSIKNYFLKEGDVCEVAETFSKASEKLYAYSYDVVLLDIMLPDGNGFSLLRVIKENSPQTGIVIISAKNALNDKLTGLDLGADGGESLSAEATTFSGRMGAFYRNSKLLNAQMTWWYRAPQNTPQGTRQSISSLDVGLSKDVLKNNGTLSLSVRDLFNTRKYRGETITETFRSESQFQWRRGPTAVLSFTYRLNQKKTTRRKGRS